MLPYKNIVFDMGRVLVDYEADKATRMFTDNEEFIREVDLVIYKSGEWIMMDAGMISEEEALEAFLKRCSCDEVREIARKSFETWDEFNLYPHPKMDQVVKELKKKGYQLYVLSNISERLNGKMEKIIPNSELFNGIFMSAPHKCMKPQPIIYKAFCEEYNLKAEECLFIDDIPRNVEGAKQIGMNGYVFDGDVEKLREVLKLN